MGRVNIRPPEGYYDWLKEQQLEWVGALLAEVAADYDAESDPDDPEVGRDSPSRSAGGRLSTSRRPEGRHCGDAGWNVVGPDDLTYGS